ncbi:MAG: DUF1161 domain-containing protein [Pseudomonadota bacterium]
MKQVIHAVAAVAFVFVSGTAFAQIKPCEELKTEIAAKLDAKGVVGYSLTITPNDQVKPEDKVVGSCDGSTQKIVYVRGGAAAAPAPAPVE